MNDNLYEKQVFGLILKVIPEGSFQTEDTNQTIEYGRSIKLSIGQKHFKLTALQALGLKELLSENEFSTVIKPWAMEEKIERQTEMDLIKKL